jgi:hypothetical protein
MADETKQDKLWLSVKKLAADIEYGEFTVTYKIHEGQVREGKVFDIVRTFRA